MFYGENIQDTRQVFFSSWHKYRHHHALSELEKQVVAVILNHPEYQALLEATQFPSDKAYLPELGETNPFLHMGLHLAIRDQIAMDNPAGITQVFQQIVAKCKDESAAEHLLMEQLVECLWQAQRHKMMPNEQGYLQACQQLLYTI